MSSRGHFLLLALASMLALVAFSQEPPIDSETGKYTYQGVVQVPSVSAASILSRAKDWVAHTFKSPKDAIQLEDAAANRIVIKGSAGGVYYRKMPCLITFVLTIEAKEGKYRFTFSDLGLSGGGPDAPLEGTATTKGFEDIPRQAHQVMLKVIENLKRSMAAGSQVGNPDW